MTRMIVKKSTHHLAQNADPNSLKTLQVGVARQLLQAHKCKNALGLRLRSRLKRPPSSSRPPLQSLGRPCPRPRWMFPSLLRKCLAFSLFFCATWELPCYRQLILLLDRVGSELSVLPLPGPPWTFTRTKMMRRLRTHPLPKQVQLHYFTLILSICIVGRLNSCSRVLYNTTECH